MGFYAPAQIVRDAERHGVMVRSVDVNFSDWDSTLEDGEGIPSSAVIPVKAGIHCADAGTRKVVEIERGGAMAPGFRRDDDAGGVVFSGVRSETGFTAGGREVGVDPSPRPSPARGEGAATRLHQSHADMADDILSTHAVRLGLRQI